VEVEITIIIEWWFVLQHDRQQVVDAPHIYCNACEVLFDRFDLPRSYLLLSWLNTLSQTLIALMDVRQYSWQFLGY